MHNSAEEFKKLSITFFDILVFGQHFTLATNP